MSDLSLKATRGVLWNLTESFGLQVVQLVISIVLARLLLPEQYGLIGMLALFIALAQSILDSGFGAALIQKKETDHLDECSVFYFNLLLGVALTVGLGLLAPPIARFYQEPILVPLTRFLALSIFINAFSLVPSVVLTKRMDFRAQFAVSAIAAVVSGAIGIAMAFRGLGVWSLAAQAVLASLFRAILLWVISGWRPSPIFSMSALKGMFPFGSRILLSGLLDTFFNNIYLPLIGRFFSPADLGYFVRAQTLQLPATQTLGNAVGRVLAPALAPQQDQPAALRQAARRTTTTTVFLQFPLMVGLIVAANPLITVLLTERWLPSVPYFQLFCVIGLFYPVHVINLLVLRVMGRSDLFFRLEVIKKVLIVLAILATFRMGIMALLWGQVAVSLIALFLNTYYTGRLIGYTGREQMIDVAPYLFAVVFMGVGMAAAGTLVSPNWLKLIVEGVVGAGIYLGITYLFGSAALSDVSRVTKQLVPMGHR